MKAIAIACYAGAVLLLIDVLRIGSVVGDSYSGRGVYRSVYYKGVLNNITINNLDSTTIQYIVIIALVGLGTFFLTHKNRTIPKKSGGE